MARRRTKTTQDTDDTWIQTVNGTEGQVHQSRTHDTAAVAGNGIPAADIRSRIEKLAYQLYEQRGCRHGDDWKDWLEAERLTLGALT